MGNSPICRFGILGYIGADCGYSIYNQIRLYLGGRKLPLSQRLDYELEHLGNMSSIGPVSYFSKQKTLWMDGQLKKICRLNEEIEKGLESLRNS